MPRRIREPALRRARRLLALGLALAVIAGADGCSLRRRHHAADQAASAGKLYSPNGERLNGGPLGRPTCAAALTAWFERADANHDGVIDRDEFLADARRQFAVMDLDKDGIVTPSELAQYRAPYETDAAPAAGAPGPAPASDQSSERQRRRDGDHPGGSNLAVTEGSGDERPDPVMAADVGFRNQVSLQDFIAYAGRQFAALDAAHQGRLAKADVLRVCQPPDE